jgi:hypothetical protein
MLDDGKYSILLSSKYVCEDWKPHMYQILCIPFTLRWLAHIETNGGGGED